MDRRKQSLAGLAAVAVLRLCFFFFQAEDGIRDVAVTGVQTCALPIFPDSTQTKCRCSPAPRSAVEAASSGPGFHTTVSRKWCAVICTAPLLSRSVSESEIGRASCRERVYSSGVAGPLKKNISRIVGQR